MRLTRGVLGWLPALTLLVMLGPVCAGVLGTLMAALGHLPAAGLYGPDLGAVTAMAAWPGLPRAMWLSLSVGICTTLSALLIVALLMAGWSGSRPFRLIQRLLSPILSVPHAAAAFGLAFLVAPSGWLVRLVSPELTGWTRPPDLLILQDPWGVALMAGLLVKEVPFLLLMMLAALSQADAERRMLVARTLGYGRIAGWLLTVFPSVYAQMRLPVYVVLAYAMSVVDVALILGPTTPATLSVQIVRWMADPELAQRLTASAAAVLQALLVLAALAFWRAGEMLVRRIGTRQVFSGRRYPSERITRAAVLALGLVSAGLVLCGLAVLALWSVAGFWGFPDALPQSLTLSTWMRHAPAASQATAETALIAATATLIAIALTIGCLEAEQRQKRLLTRRGLLLLYLPLLVPQTAFLPGLQTLLLSFGVDTGRVPVIFAHLVFVLPYVFLSLSDPYRAWDGRLATIGAALGATPNRVFWRLRLPMLLRPVLTAMAVGFAVSVGQYLPTLLIGGGRTATLTTEALALASGGDRAAIGVFALLQTAAALLPFALALAIPAIVWRNRRSLAHVQGA